MSLLFKQNKICRFHGVPHPQGTNCTGIDYDPSQEPAAQLEYEAAYHNDKDGTDAAGRVIDKRGKLVATRPVKKQPVSAIVEEFISPEVVVSGKYEPLLVLGHEAKLDLPKPETKIVNSIVQPKATEVKKTVFIVPPHVGQNVQVTPEMNVSVVPRPVKKADAQFVGNLKATSADKNVEQKIETKPNGVIVITETISGTSELPLIEKKPETKIVNSVAQPKVTETVKALTKDQVLADPIIPSEEEKSKD